MFDKRKPSAPPRPDGGRRRGATVGVAASRPGCRPRLWLSMLAAITCTCAQASMFKGETVDKLADILSWVVLIVAPIAGITVFLLIHILPEKIAEKKGHPQAGAIKTLCLLSLVFGGLLWPLAWLWAYTKPVLYKMAYGTDYASGHEPPPGVVEPTAVAVVEPTAVAVVEPTAVSVGEPTPPSELESLRRRIDELEALVSNSSTKGGRV